jgi:membrane protein
LKEFAPILLVISSSATVLVSSHVKVIVNKMGFLGVFSSVIFFLLNLLPYVSIWFLLTMLYLIMPNTRIPVRSGILGAMAADELDDCPAWRRNRPGMSG